MNIKSLIKKSIGQVWVDRVKRLINGIKNPSESILTGKIQLNDNWELNEYRIKNNEVFFGYYDKRQLSLCGSRLLSNSVSSKQAGQSEPKFPMHVGWFDVETKEFNTIAKTVAFNWQQGCMLRWVPNSNDELITYNDWDGTQFVSIVVNSTTGAKVCERLYPTYDISQSGNFIATCDFSRLHNHRIGYGYWQREFSRHIGVEHSDVICLKIYNSSNDKLLREISLSEICNRLEIKYNPEKSYVNHISFSPNSDKVIFYFFWGHQRINNMAVLLYEINLDCLSIVARNYTSHFSWSGNDKIVAWGADELGAQAYYEYNLINGSQKIYWKERGISDGHCTIISDSSVLTDTYPDSSGFQHLFLRSVGGEISTLAKIYSPARFSFDLRCDLHPRTSIFDDVYSFDSAARGSRSTYIIRKSK